MAYKELQVRRDTAANWTTNDPTLKAGEFGYETDTGKLKVGDGSTAWTSLDYITGAGSDAFTVKIDAAATAGYLGAAAGDGVLRTSTGLSYADGGDYVTLTTNDGEIDHNSLSNYDGNKHVDHTGVTLTAGTGLTGGGDISSNRTFNVDIGITDDKILQVDDADAADNDYAKFTADGIEGRSYSEVREDLNLVIETTKTVNFTSDMSAAEIQALIDAVGRNISDGTVLTFQFGDGTYTLTDRLYFAGFYGGGQITIQGDRTETDNSILHTSQDVFLDFTGETHGIVVVNTTNTVYIYNLKIEVDNSAEDVRAIWMQNVNKGTLLYNYVLGSSVAQGSGFQFDSGIYYCQANYVSNVKYGIRSLFCRTYSGGNDETGTDPAYGLVAQYASTVGKYGTQPAGSTANELESTGGVIRA